MSRIGRLPVKLPAGVEAKVEGLTINVKGPKGALSFTFDKHMKVTIKDGEITVERPNDSVDMRALHGTTRAIINDMVTGVTQGYSKQLEVKGVGYRCEMQGTNLVLHVGHSHPDTVVPPKDIKLSTKGLVITVEGIDAQKVGQVASNIRQVRKPEPYHGKGIRYVGEVISLRTPSAKKKGAAAPAGAAPAGK